MSYNRRLVAPAVAILLSMLAPQSAAHSELAVSQLIVELQRGKVMRQDIEVSNSGSELTYVAIEPVEVLDAGTSGETRLPNPDPERLGLLVSPSRMVLEPGQRKLIRIASIDGSADRERVYRVTVKPVVGQLTSEQSALKILIAYEVLVLARPTSLRPQVSGTRVGNVLLIRNNGNVSVELTDGKQCDPSGKTCEELPGGRLYAGAEKKITLKPSLRPSYVAKAPGKLIPLEFE